MTDRRHDLDWLRVLATLLLLPFHVGKVFDVEPYYHVKDAHPSEMLGMFTGFIHLFHMPLFFVLAGWAAHASMLRRRGPAFVRERLERLLLPLVVVSFGVLPVVGWIDHRHIQGGAESFTTYLPTFYTRLDRFNWSHLWFLAYLLTFTLVYRPLMRRWMAWTPARPTPWWLVPGFVAVLAIAQGSLRGRWPGFQNLYDDWANVVWYSLFFLAGFALAHHPQLEASVLRRWRPLLGMGLGAAAFVGLLSSGVSVPAHWWVEWTASAVAAVGIVGGLLGTAARWLNRTWPVLDHARPAAFPVYLVHQPAIVLWAVVVVGTSWPLPAKFAVLLLAASATTFAVYELVIARSATVRSVLGLRADRGVLRRPAGTPGSSPAVGWR